MAGMANYDYDVDAQNLQRRLQLAQAMEQGGLAPMGQTEMVGGYAVKKSPLEALAKVAQAYFGKKAEDNVTSQQRDLSNRYRGDLQSGVSQLIDGLASAPGQNVPAVQGNNPSAFVPEHTMSAQDAQAAKREAILKAIGSNVPPVQQLGQAMLKSLLADGTMTTKDILGMADKWDPQSLLEYQRTGNPQVLKPKMSYHTANNQIFGEQGGKFSVGVDARDRYGPVGTIAQGPAGPVIGQVEQGTGKANFAPGGTKVEVNTTQKAGDAFATNLAKDRATMISESYKVAKDLPATLQSIHEAQNTLQAGIVSGAGADVQLAASKIAQKLGFGEVDPAVANSEEFRGKMAASVLDKIKQLRPASDQDVKYAKEASGADLNLSLQALGRLLDSAEATTINTYMQHEHLLQQAAGGTGAIPQDLQMFHIDMPFTTSDRLQYSGGRFSPKPPIAAPGSPASNNHGGAPIPLDEYLRQKGVR